jgi:hypothetical protein
MKSSMTWKGLVLGAVLAVASSGFAASGNLSLTTDTNVNGTALKAGDYKVSWDGNGPAVDVKIMSGKKVVATVPARVVTLPSASLYDSAVVNSAGTGRTLSEIRFSGKTIALAIGRESAGMQDSSK